MKRLGISIAVVLMGCVVVAAAAGAQETGSLADKDYVIGPGDVLDIAVWKEEALTRLLTVLPDGKINFPLIGEVAAGGRTVGQLKKDMESKLAPFVPDPVLSVGVHQVNSMLIYVIGRVNNPGRFILNANINMLQALSMAGGLNSFAKRSEIRLFREKNGKTEIYEFDYDDVSAGSRLEQNITLMRGDVIVVR